MAFRSIRLHAQHQANRHCSLPAPTHSTSLDISLTHPFKITFKWLRDLSNPLPDTSSAVPLREAVRIATEEFGILQGTAATLELMVERKGIEPSTFALRTRRSPS